MAHDPTLKPNDPHVGHDSRVMTSDVNDAELLMPSRDFWFLMPNRDFHFRKKTSPSRTETLAKRDRAELRLLQNITEP